MRQRVAVIGAGAVGSYYGMRLAEAGHDVRFLVRRDYDAVSQAGLTLHSPLGNLQLRSPTIAPSSEALAEHGPVDWLLLGLKATAIPALAELASPLLSSHTRVISIMNGLSVDDEVAAQLPGVEVFGGMGFIGVSRGEPGIVNHQEFGALNLGHRGDKPEQLSEAAALFEGSKVELRPEPSLLKARWEKLGWNIPFNGLCVIAGGVATDQVIHDPALRDTAHAIMQEVVASGNADLSAQGAASRIDGAALCHQYLTQTAGMGAYRPSTVIDYNEGRPLEVKAIFQQPVERSKELGVDCPMMAMTASLVRSLGVSG